MAWPPTEIRRLVEALAQGRDLPFDGFEAGRRGRPFQLLVEGAQHLLRQAGGVGSLAELAQLLLDAVEALDQGFVGGSLPFGGGLDPGGEAFHHVRQHAALVRAAGRQVRHALGQEGKLRGDGGEIGRGRFGAAGQEVDPPAEALQLLGNPARLLRGGGDVEGRADIVEGILQGREVALVHLMQAQLRDLAAEGSDLVREPAELLRLGAGGEVLAQVDDLAAQEIDDGAVDARLRDRVDPGP